MSERAGLACCGFLVSFSLFGGSSPSAVHFHGVTKKHCKKRGTELIRSGGARDASAALTQSIQILSGEKGDAFFGVATIGGGG